MNDLFDFMVFPIPKETYDVISGEASKRGISFAQLLGEAIDEYLKNHPVRELKVKRVGG